MQRAPAACQHCMKPEWHPDELAQHWTLSSDERALLSNKTGATRLRFAVLLKVFQYPNLPRGFVNIRLTRFNKIGRLYHTIIAAPVIRSCDLARRDVGSTPSSKRGSLHSYRLTRAKPRCLLSEMRSSNHSGERLGGIRGCRVPSGCQRRWHWPRQLGSAFWRHLPGQKRPEVLRAFATMVRTGLQKRMQPMVGMQPPQQDRLPHTEPHRGQMRAPHPPRAIIILAPHDRVAPRPCCGIVVHSYCRALDKDGESIPVVLETAEDCELGTVEVWLLQIRLAAALPLVQVALERVVARNEGPRVLSEWQRVVPCLEAGAIELIQGPNIMPPAPHPILTFWPTASRPQQITPPMRPARGQQQLIHPLGEAFLGAVTVTHQHHCHQVSGELVTMAFGHLGTTTGRHAVKHHGGGVHHPRYQR